MKLSHSNPVSQGDRHTHSSLRLQGGEARGRRPRPSLRVFKPVLLMCNHSPEAGVSSPFHREGNRGPEVVACLSLVIVHLWACFIHL